MKKSMFFAALMAVLCVFSSCEHDVDTIIGKWQATSMHMQLIMNDQVVQTVEQNLPNDEAMFWQFDDESTGKMIEAYDGEEWVEAFTYTLNDNALKINVNGMTMDLQVVSLTKTELELAMKTEAEEGANTYYRATYKFTRVTE
jgi:hypothetical protein